MKINNYLSYLEKDKQTVHKPIHNLKLLEFDKIMMIYIEINLKSEIIRFFKFFTRVFILLFTKK